MKARTAVLAALISLAIGCGGGDPCAGSPCANDSKPTSTQYQNCVNQHNDNKNAKCNAQSVAIELCAQQNTVCTSGGTTDGSRSSTAFNANCKAATDALVCCIFSSSACR